MARVGATVALVVAIAAAFDLRTQLGVWRAEQTASAQSLALARGDHDAAVAEERADASGAAPRAQVYHALMLARTASVAQPPRRQSLLNAAARSIAIAERARPDWGEALVIDAYIGTLAEGDALSARTIAVLSASYRAAPYLHDAGAWRARAGLALWSRLPADAQGHVIDEAVWTARLSSAAGSTLFDAARASPGYARFATAWLANRRSDRDIAAPGDRATP